MGGGSWLNDNWFTLVQTVGIVASLYFTAAAFRTDKDERRLGNLLRLTGHHAEIWREFAGRPDLARSVDPLADIERSPVTDSEEVFVALLILHLNVVYRAHRLGLVENLGQVEKDIREFFGLPIPKAVWRKLKLLHHEEFVTFVEACLARD